MTTTYYQGSEGPVYVVDGVHVYYRTILGGTPTNEGPTPTHRIACEVHGEAECEHKSAADVYRMEDARENLRFLGLL